MESEAFEDLLAVPRHTKNQKRFLRPVLEDNIYHVVQRGTPSFRDTATRVVVRKCSWEHSPQYLVGASEGSRDGQTRTQKNLHGGG